MANIIVGLIVLACLAVAARHIYKLFQGETSCCGGSTAPKVPAKKLTGPIVGENLVKIDGMTCANCKNRVELLLGGIDGAAKVNLHRGCATVRMTRDVSDEEIRRALAGSGYAVQAIEQG